MPKAVLLSCRSPSPPAVASGGWGRLYGPGRERQERFPVAGGQPAARGKWRRRSPLDPTADDVVAPLALGAGDRLDGVSPW